MSHHRNPISTARPASARQYAQEALASSAYTVLIDIDSLGSEEAAVASATAAHAWERAELAERQASFVQAADQRRAVRVADALTARGLADVLLLTDAESTTPSLPTTR